ncbi:MAG: hypothetical protein WC096_02705 [Sphaerochaetaceae bacterium]
MEMNEMSEVLIRIDERTKNIQDDVKEISVCINDHERRIRALELLDASEHGTSMRPRQKAAIATGAGASAGTLFFVIGKIFGWFRNA